MRILDYYDWDTIAVVYYVYRSPLIPRCTLVLSALDVTTYRNPLDKPFQDLIINTSSNISIIYRKRLRSDAVSEMRTALQELSSQTRGEPEILPSNAYRNPLKTLCFQL